MTDKLPDPHITREMRKQAEEEKQQAKWDEFFSKWEKRIAYMKWYFNEWKVNLPGMIKWHAWMAFVYFIVFGFPLLGIYYNYKEKFFWAKFYFIATGIVWVTGLFLGLINDLKERYQKYKYQHALKAQKIIEQEEKQRAVQNEYEKQKYEGVATEEEKPNVEEEYKKGLID